MSNIIEVHVGRGTFKCLNALPKNAAKITRYDGRKLVTDIWYDPSAKALIKRTSRCPLEVQKYPYIYMHDSITYRFENEPRSFVVDKSRIIKDYLANKERAA